MKSKYFLLGAAAMQLLALCNCSRNSTHGEFQEDIPGGGQAIVKYERENGAVKQIVYSTESAKYFVESTYFYSQGELSSVCVSISDYVRNDVFDVINARKVAALKWVIGKHGLVLKEGQLDENIIGKSPDYLTESKRLNELIDKNMK